MGIIATGSYVGNGSGQSIDVGWQPAMVVIHSTNSGGSQGNRALTIKSKNMPDDDAMACSTAAAVINGVTLGSNGFTVGSPNQVNMSGQTYHWMAVQDVADVVAGTYTGAVPRDDHAFQDVNLGAQPELVLCFDMDGNPVTGSGPMVILASNGGNSGSPGGPCFFRDAWTGNLGNGALVITTTGFKVNNAFADDWNLENSNYLYVAVFNTSGVNIESGQYTISTPPPVAVTTANVPKAVWIIHDLAGGFKTDTMPNDDSGKLTDKYDFDTSGGVTVQSPGFSVGSDYITADKWGVRTTAWVAWH